MTRQQLMNECDMLQDDINRMMVTNDAEELLRLFAFAHKHLGNILWENQIRIQTDKLESGNDGMTLSKPYRFIGLSKDIEEVKKMLEYNNQIIPDKSTAIAVDNTNEQFIFQDGKWRKMTIKMSIDEAIPILHDMYNYYNDVDVDAYVGFDNEDNNAIETALDTMRKYKKIEKIINAPIGGTSAKYNAIVNLIKYSEVEDGNDD